MILKLIDTLDESERKLCTHIFIFLLTCIGYRLWMEGRFLSSTFSAAGKVIIVTGATSGIGRETAFDLAARGGCIILACRNKERATVTRKQIISATHNHNIHYIHLDLASLASVRSFARQFQQQFNRLDILVNNAGVMAAVPHELTEDGLEPHMAINHYGHYLLTSLLVDCMRRSTPSRIITLTSEAHKLVQFRRDDETAKELNRFEAYAQSHLANIYFTQELSERLRDTGVTANCLRPGLVHTRITRNLESWCFLFSSFLCDLMSKIFLRSAKSGAQCTLYAALDFNLQNVSGQYLSNMWMGRLGANAQNKEHAKILWQRSQRVTNAKW